MGMVEKEIKRKREKKSGEGGKRGRRRQRALAIRTAYNHHYCILSFLIIITISTV